MNEANQALSGDERFPRLEVPAEVQLRALALGIDAQASIDRFMGRAALFLRMSKSFKASSENLVTELQVLQTGGQLAQAAARLHAFKGLAGTLGLAGLHARGEVGEAMLVRGEALSSAWVAELEQSILQDCRVLIELAQELQALDGAKASQAAELDVTSFEDDCSSLMAQLRNGDMAATQTFSLLLTRHSLRLGSQQEPLAAALDVLNFDAALAICSKLMAEGPDA